MVESRWGRRIGPAVAVLGALALVTTTTVGARDRSWDPPPCAAIPRQLGRRLRGRGGGWTHASTSGRLTGQRLALGGPGGRARWIDLPAEAFAAGPFAGQVLVGTDDGDGRRLSLVDPARGCAAGSRMRRTSSATATLTPDRTAILEIRVDRRTRADLGVSRRPLDGGAAVRLLGPIAPDARFGRTWSTDWSGPRTGRRSPSSRAARSPAGCGWSTRRPAASGSSAAPDLGDSSASRPVASSSARPVGACPAPWSPPTSRPVSA